MRSDARWGESFGNGSSIPDLKRETRGTRARVDALEGMGR